jgi:hypothetical protein
LANINFVVKNDIELKGNLIFEGTTPNSFETTLAITDPTSDRTITFPNSTGTVALTSDLSSYLTTSSASTTYVTKNSDSNYNVKLGTSSMKYLTTGEENVAIGHESIGTLSTGYGNVGVGFRSLSGNESGAYNVAIGYNSLYGPTGSNNIAIGQYAGNSIGNGNYNVVIGSNDGLTISNLNNNVIIADGQGNIRIRSDSAGAVTMPSYSTVGLLKNDGNGLITSSAGSDLIKTIVTNGSLATNYAFTVPVKSQCLISWSASGYLASTGLATWTLNVDGVATASTSRHFFNSPSDHQASPTAFYTAALSAGSHTISVSYNGAFDFNDFVYASVVMLPVS